MNYLLLDSGNLLEPCGIISKKEVMKELGFNHSQMDNFVMYCHLYQGKYILVEDEKEFNADKTKMFYETETKKYYANDDGEFYSIDRRTEKKKKLTVHKKEGILVLHCGKKIFNAIRLHAKLFMKHYDESNYYFLKDQHGEIVVKNILSETKEEHYNRTLRNCTKKGQKKVGLFKNAQCIKEYSSAKETSLSEHYNYSHVLKVLNGERKTDGLDIRYLNT